MLRSLLKANLACAIGVLRKGKSRCLIYTYLCTTLHICNNSTGLAFASAMNPSDYIFKNSQYFFTILPSCRQTIPSLTRSLTTLWCAVGDTYQCSGFSSNYTKQKIHIPNSPVHFMRTHDNGAAHNADTSY